MTYNIAKNELKNLFYSPVAWFILLIFFIQCSYFYYEVLVVFANKVEILSKNNPEKAFGQGLDATRILMEAFFSNVLNNLFFYIPLLTMGAINREINNGSMSLLLSSPIKRRNLVFGKFVGLMLFNFLLVAVISLFLIFTAIIVRNVEYNVLFTALSGFVLLLCMFTAIGLFMSSITRYQIVAVIGTFTILMILTNIHTVWQEYDFVRDISWFLSIKYRLNTLLYGLFRSRDIVYFLAITGMFIGFTFIKLSEMNESKAAIKRTTRYLLVIAIGLTVGLVGSMRKFSFYWDATKNDQFTVPQEYQDLMKSFDKNAPIEVTFHVNLLDELYGYGDPRNINPTLDLIWDPFLRFNPNIDFKYEYYYDYNPLFDYYYFKTSDSLLYKQRPGMTLKQIAHQSSVWANVDIQKFKDPEQMRKTINLDSEGYKLLMVLKYKDRQEVLRYYMDPQYVFPDIINIAGAMKRLQYDEHPKVVYTTGHLERDIYKNGRREFRIWSGAKNNRRSLLNDGFGVDTINLGFQQIAADLSCIVIADPKVAFTSEELKKMEQYIAEGGNLMVMSVPGKQTVINPILKMVGLEFLPGQLASHNLHNTSDVIPMLLETEATQLAPKSPGFADYFRLLELGKWKLGGKIDGFDQHGAVAMKIIDSSMFHMQPIGFTSAGYTWLKRTPLDIDSAKATYTPAEGDSAGVFPIGMMLSRQVGNKEQRIVVWNSVINYNDDTHYFLEPYSWLHYNEYPMYKPKTYQEDQIVIGRKAALAWQTVFLYLLPGCTLALSSIMLIRRKRK